MAINVGHTQDLPWNLTICSKEFLESALQNTKPQLIGIRYSWRKVKKTAFDENRCVFLLELGSGRNQRRGYDLFCLVPTCWAEYHLLLVHEDLSPVKPYPLFQKRGKQKVYPQGHEVDSLYRGFTNICADVPSGKQKLRFRFVIIGISAASVSLVGISYPCHFFTRPEQLPKPFRSMLDSSKNGKNRFTRISSPTTAPASGVLPFTAASGDARGATRKRQADNAALEEISNGKVPKLMDGQSTVFGTSQTEPEELWDEQCDWLVGAIYEDCVEASPPTACGPVHSNFDTSLPLGSPVATAATSAVPMLLPSSISPEQPRSSHIRSGIHRLPFRAPVLPTAPSSTVPPPTSPSPNSPSTTSANGSRVTWTAPPSLPSTPPTASPLAGLWSPQPQPMHPRATAHIAPAPRCDLAAFAQELDCTSLQAGVEFFQQGGAAEGVRVPSRFAAKTGVSVSRGSAFGEVVMGPPWGASVALL